jgi:O-antigen/teichoic acid export membrane protein
MKPALRSILSIAAGDVAVRLLGFLVTIFLARVLEPAHFGVISVGFAVLGYFGQLSGSGVQMLEARNTAARSDVDVARVGAVTSLRVSLAMVLVLITIILCFVFVESTDTRDIVWLYSLILIPLAVSLDWFFQGKERFGILSLSKVLNYTVYAVAVYLFVGGPTDVRLVPLAFFAGTFVAAVFLLAQFRRSFGDLRFGIHPTIWKDLIKQGLPLGLAMFLGQSAFNAAPIIIGLQFSNTDVGMYSAGMKVIVLLLLLDRTVNSFFLPVVSRLQSTRPDELPRMVEITMKFVFVAALLLAGCCFIIADDLVVLLFGADYAAAAEFLRTLLAYFVLTLPNSVLVCTIVASGREAEYRSALLVSSLILIGSVITLAFLLGPIGGAVGVAIGELSMLVMLLASTRRFMVLSVFRPMVRPLISFAAMIGMVLVFDDWNNTLLLVASVTVFVMSVFAPGGIEAAEIRFLRRRLV